MLKIITVLLAFLFVGMFFMPVYAAPDYKAFLPPPTLTVDSLLYNGTTISGMSIVLFQNGSEVASGFTPVTFTLDIGISYQVYANSYGQLNFIQWYVPGSFIVPGSANPIDFQINWQGVNGLIDAFYT